MIDVYLSDDCSKLIPLLPKNCFKFPESGLNAKQIKEFIQGLKSNDSLITSSLYLIREIYLAKIPVIWHNHNYEKGEIFINELVDNIRSIEVLDRELEQSDRYCEQDI